MDDATQAPGSNDSNQQSPAVPPLVDLASIHAHPAEPGAAQPTVAPNEVLPNVGQPQSTTPKRSRRIWAVVLVLLLLVIGGSVLAWYQWPQQVINRLMSADLARMNQFAYASTTSFSAETQPAQQTDTAATALLDQAAGQPVSQVSGTLTIQGEVDAKDTASPKTHAVIQLESQPVGFGDISAELTTVGDVFYVKFTKVPGIAALIDTSSFINKWIVIDPAALAKKYNQESSYEKYKQDSQLTPDQEKAIDQKFIAAKVVTLAKAFPLSIQDRTVTHHYQLAINPDALVTFLQDAASIAAKQTLTAEQVDSYRQDAAALNKADIQVWLGWFDGLPRKVAISVPLQVSSNTPIGTVTNTTTFSGVGKKPVITIPTDTISIEQLIEDFTHQSVSPTEIPEPVTS